MSALQQLAERRDRKVRLTNSAWTHQQKPRLTTGRIILREPLYYKLGLGQAAIPRNRFCSAFPKICIEIIEIAVLISGRDPGTCKRA
jgi:hypothetical protein